MFSKNTVSHQDAHQKQGDLEAAKGQRGGGFSQCREAAANLSNSRQVVAPFDGFVTERNVEVGNLISSTLTAGQKPLFQIADDRVLRTYINVPETQAGQIKIGQPAKLSLSSSPGELITGQVVHTASAIDPQSRTLLVEIQVDNAGRKLLAGGYAIIHLPIRLEKPALILPVERAPLSPRGDHGRRGSHEGTVALKVIKIGKDFGTNVEVIDGLAWTTK